MPIAGILEVVDSGLYDTVGFPRPSRDAEMPRVRLFTVPIGYMDRHIDGRFEPKTEIETNMADSESLPPPRKFAVAAIRAAFIGLSGELLSLGAASKFYRAAVLTFLINSKPYCQLPLWKVIDPAVLFTDPQAYVELMRQLTREERADYIRGLRRQFSEPLLIDFNNKFFCELCFDQLVAWDSLSAPAGVVVILEGQEARAVQ